MGSLPGMACTLFHLSVLLNLPCSNSQSWFRGDDWHSRSEGIHHAMNFFTSGPTRINIVRSEDTKAKISFARRGRVLAFDAFHVANHDQWELSSAAQEEGEDRRNKKPLLVIILVAVAVVVLVLGTIFCCFKRIVLKARGVMVAVKRSLKKVKNEELVSETLNSNANNLKVFKFSTLTVATNNFSNENKLGEGGYGPVYKASLPKGQEIAVKRLSKASHQGLEEFENEIKLTSKLQHVNLAPVMGICTEREEKMLIYEYMPNRSLDVYIFDPRKRFLLDWKKRVHIIEGITQGLLYLQEYSNFTIVHRDLKTSNILLDNNLNPKISDFGIARTFTKEDCEANTGHIVGTCGYAPPEYLRKGIYSMKYDVYSYGVVLLQLISGKRTTCYYGCNEDLDLLEYAYRLWKDGKGEEFFDSSLDDSSSTWKLMICVQVALLCVQENPEDRPTMLEVFTMLKNESEAIPSPKKPASSIKRDHEDEESRRRLKENLCSLSDATITQLVPR